MPFYKAINECAWNALAQIGCPDIKTRWFRNENYIRRISAVFFINIIYTIIQYLFFFLTKLTFVIIFMFLKLNIYFKNVILYTVEQRNQSLAGIFCSL